MSRFASLVRGYFPVEEGYTLNVLDHQVEEPVSWRLDCTYNRWIYLEWGKGKAQAVIEVDLKDDEVLGFFKAKFPELNIRRELVDAVTERLRRVIADFEKEASA